MSSTSTKSRSELLSMCKSYGLKGVSSKSKAELFALLEKHNIKEKVVEEEVDVKEKVVEEEVDVKEKVVEKDNKEDILQGDVMVLLSTLKSGSAQIVIADPPYNIGKDFGNDSDKQPMDMYLYWCDKWIEECLRILRDDGTMFIYGFSEILALILARIPYNINRRWLVWHYTNKNVASLNFWQRSHESILVLWKKDKVFHKDSVREPYTETFLQNSAGKKRKSTIGRFSKGDKETTYQAHPGGALPRDVIKIPALAGGAGVKERVDHPTQKPLAICEKLLRSCCQESEKGFVLVPFAGSGSECVMAKKLGLPFIGIEINPSYVELIKHRLSSTKKLNEDEDDDDDDEKIEIV